MIMNYFKKYINAFLFLCIFSTITYYPVYSMNQLNYGSLKKYAKNFVHVFDKTMLFSVTILSQLPNSSGYESATPAICSIGCAQNCSVSIVPECDLTFEKAVIPLTVIGSAFFMVGMLVGCYKAKYPDEYQQNE